MNKQLIFVGEGSDVSGDITASEIMSFAANDRVFVRKATLKDLEELGVEGDYRLFITVAK